MPGAHPRHRFRGQRLASGQVIGAIGRAMQLTPDEHEHLRLLAGLTPPEPAAQAADLRRFSAVLEAAGAVLGQDRR